MEAIKKKRSDILDIEVRRRVIDDAHFKQEQKLTHVHEQLVDRLSDFKVEVAQKENQHKQKREKHE